mgnify:FL=1
MHYLYIDFGLILLRISIAASSAVANPPLYPLIFRTIQQKNDRPNGSIPICVLGAN